MEPVKRRDIKKYGMKKRHVQLLVLTAFSLMVMFNIPLVMGYSSNTTVLGVPTFFFVLFAIWLLGILVSIIILNKYRE